MRVADNAPEAIKAKEHELATGRPKVNVWACIIMLIITIGIMAATAEWVRTLSRCICIVRAGR